MDDLDRLFRRLVQNIRNGYPEYLTRPFEVSELFQNLIPYRHNRRELEIETNGDYEVALCRLLSGERGYASGDETMSEAIRRELGSPNPNTAIFREFAASSVSLSPEALRRFDQNAADQAPQPSPTPLSISVLPVEPPAAAPSSAPAPVRSAAAESTRSAPAATERQPASAAASQAAVSAPPSQRRADNTSAPAAASGPSCRYCGGTLPTDRRVIFCPHCGQNLMVVRCPACSSEMETGWKFCITCGRGV